MFKNKHGFTIVELLIVIVVIGILASITIVAYNGIQSRAYNTGVQSDLRNFGNIMQQQKAINGTYPSVLTAAMGIKFSRSIHGIDDQFYGARYCYNADTDNFILYASTKSGNYYKVTGNGKVESTIFTSGWGVCGQIGMTNANPTQNGLYQTTWDTWVN